MITNVDDLPDEWDEQAKMIEELGDTGEGGTIANRRVAATLRTCADAFRAVKAREAESESVR